MKNIVWAALAAFIVFGCSKQSDTAPNANTSTVADGVTAGAPIDQVTLRLTGNKGDKFMYELGLDATADYSGVQLPEGMPPEEAAKLKGEQKASVAGKQQVEITEVKDGKVTITSTLIEVDGKATGTLEGLVQQLREDKGKAKTRTYDERNRPVGDTNSSGVSPMKMTFPEKAIKAGDSWDEETEIMGQKVQGKFKVEAFEKVGEADAVKISMTAPPSKEFTLSQPFNVWYDVKTGQPLRIEGQFTGETQGAKLTMRVWMKRV